MSEVKNPMDIANHLWDSTPLKVTEFINKKSYQIGAMEAVKYMRNHPEETPVSDAVDMELVKGCVKRLSDLKKYHINPYNLGEQGEVGSLITTLAQIFKLPPPSSPTPTNVQEQGGDYNQAIQDTLSIIQKYNTGKELSPLFNQLVPKIEALVKSS